MSEHALQVAVAQMLQLVLDPALTFWTAIDHGAGKLSKRAAGMMKARGVKRGLPDFIIMMKDRPIIGLELKTTKGRLSPAQNEVACTWGWMGHGIYVARSLAEVQEILDHCHIPMTRRMTLFLEPDHDRRPARAAPSRHPGTRRRRKPKSVVPVVLRRPA